MDNPHTKRTTALGVKHGWLTIIEEVSAKFIVSQCECGKKRFLQRANFFQALSCGCKNTRNNRKSSAYVKAFRERERVKEENAEGYIPKPDRWGVKPCPKCGGKMEADRYYSCHLCVKDTERPRDILIYECPYTA